MNHLILYRIFTEKASEREKTQFDTWVKLDDNNLKFYESFKVYFDSEPINITQEEIDMAWKSFKEGQKRRVIVLRRRLITAAASIALLIGTASLSFFTNNNDTSQLADLSVFEKSTPTKVLLTLSDGARIDLDENDEKLIKDKEGNLLAAKANNTLEYTATSDNNHKVLQKNTIEVPVGLQYNLVLSDGTKVWINSDSKLEYPVNFSGDTRDVYLEGEACFQVTKDEKRMFKVHTAESEVRVYGTTFNISTYLEDKTETVTLKSGSVAVVYDSQEMELHPNEQIVFDKALHTANTSQVDATLILAWTEGIYRFDQMPLDELATKLSRWYGVEFVFEDEISKDQRLTGAIDKNSDINVIVKLLEESTAFSVTSKSEVVYIASRH